MASTKHHRYRNHFGFDYDTNVILDGQLVTYSSGTGLHVALLDMDERIEWVTVSGGVHPNLAAHDTLGLATQAELNATTSSVTAHTTDTIDAHDAASISVLDTATFFAGTDVEAVLAEIYAAITAGGIPATIFDVKGDLIVASAADTAVRMGAAADGATLVTTSGETTGLRWRLNNDGASAAPTVNDDSGDGYSIGSRWLDTTNDKEYVSLDATAAAAVWVETTATGGGSDAYVGCFVNTTGTTSVTNNTFTAIAFAAEVNDTNGFHDNTTNNTRVTVPSGQAGYYRLTGGGEWDTNTTNERILVFRLNGGTEYGWIRANVGANNGGFSQQVVAPPIYLAVADYIELYAYQTSGTTRTIGGNNTRTFLSIELVGT